MKTDLFKDLPGDLTVDAKQKLLGLPRWLSGKESACNAGDTGLIPGSGESLDKEMKTHCTYPIYRGVWRTTVHRIKKELDRTW